MGKTEDRALVLDAAQNWQDEMTAYIIPGVLTKEERKHYRKESDKLHNALKREQGRLERKRLRDAQR